MLLSRHQAVRLAADHSKLTGSTQITNWHARTIQIGNQGGWGRQATSVRPIYHGTQTSRYNEIIPTNYTFLWAWYYHRTPLGTRIVMGGRKDRIGDFKHLSGCVVSCKPTTGTDVSLIISSDTFAGSCSHSLPPCRLISGVQGYNHSSMAEINEYTID